MRENDECPGSEGINKSDLAGRVANRIEVNRSSPVDAVFDTVGESLSAGEKVRIVGFGTFGI